MKEKRERQKWAFICSGEFMNMGALNSLQIFLLFDALPFLQDLWWQKWFMTFWKAALQPNSVCSGNWTSSKVIYEGWLSSSGLRLALWVPTSQACQERPHISCSMPGFDLSGLFYSYCHDCFLITLEQLYAGLFHNRKTRDSY